MNDTSYERAACFHLNEAKTLLHLNENKQPIHMSYHLFLHYGWFLQNLVLYSFRIFFGRPKKNVKKTEQLVDQEKTTSTGPKVHGRH